MNTATSERRLVVPPHFNLEQGVTEVVGQDGVPCLQFATSMLTLYQQTYGELSRFFQALKNGYLIGAKCPNCGMILVPPMTWNCPDCEFQEMEEVNLPHTGVLAATAPITFFPPAHMHGQAPYCRGYVDVMMGIEPASFMPARLETTTGLPRPGIFVKDVELRLVFKVEREGRITDVFWVPRSEVPRHLENEKPLLASRLNFENPKPPTLQHDDQVGLVFDDMFHALERMEEQVNKSPRARKDLGNNSVVIRVKTGGGDFDLRAGDGRLSIHKGTAGSDFTVQAEDPTVFTRWTEGGSLTDAVVEGSLWLPNRAAFAVLPMLDRLPRSIRRDKQESKFEA